MKSWAYGKDRILVKVLNVAVEDKIIMQEVLGLRWEGDREGSREANEKLLIKGLYLIGGQLFREEA